MTLLPPSHAEDALHHVVRQFTQWRRSRRLSITMCSWPGDSAHTLVNSKRGRTAEGSPRLLQRYW